MLRQFTWATTAFLFSSVTAIAEDLRAFQTTPIQIETIRDLEPANATVYGPWPRVAVGAPTDALIPWVVAQPAVPVRPSVPLSVGFSPVNAPGALPIPIPAPPSAPPPALPPMAPPPRPVPPAPLRCMFHGPGERIALTLDGKPFDLQLPHAIAHHPKVGLVTVNLKEGAKEVIVASMGDWKVTGRHTFAFPTDRNIDPSPRAVAVGSNQQIAVPLTEAGRIRTMKPNGTELSEVVNSLGYLTDIAIRGETYTVAESGGAIHFVKPGDAVWSITNVAGQGLEPRLQIPYGIAYDGEGNLWIADTGHERILRVSATDIAAKKGIPTVKQFPVPATTTRGLRGPYGLAFDEGGDLYVGFYGDQVIRRFRVTADALNEVETMSWNLGPNPRHLTVVGCDVYAADGEKTLVRFLGDL